MGDMLQGLLGAMGGEFDFSSTTGMPPMMPGLMMGPGGPGQKGPDMAFGQGGTMSGPVMMPSQEGRPPMMFGQGDSMPQMPETFGQQGPGMMSGQEWNMMPGPVMMPSQEGRPPMMFGQEWNMMPGPVMMPS